MKTVCKWLLQGINRLKPNKRRNMCQNFTILKMPIVFTVREKLLCGWWLYIQSTETGNIFLVGSVPIRRASYVKV